jgi:hypothetical protein
MKRILVMLLMLFSTAAHASDEACLALSKKVLALKGGDPNVSWAQPCKAMPDDASKTILVLGDEVMVVRTGSGQILSHGPLGTTPVGSRPASIDTAPYWLTPTVRAFGLRFSAYYPHYHGGENHQTLNMYVVEGESIRPVMELLIVSLEIGGEECADDAHEETCTQTTMTNDGTISMAKARHHGYADLIVKMRDASGKVVSNKLTYNGSRYVGPPDSMENPVDPVQ